MCLNVRYIVLLFLLPFALLCACNRPDTDLVETRFIASPTNIAFPTTIVSPELSAIDSLMWHQPDSALACLIPYFDTCCRDAKFCVSTTTEYNRHYANLLLAELLYKNDYPQTNRPALRQAVAYFDSIMQVPEPVEGPSFKRNAFLTARAHYINGVGYYEHDSVVEACAEYLKALEVMEERFTEKDLVGKKAQFMTYIYNRLGDMFEEQLLADPAITCYKQALFYCRREPTSIYGIPVLLYSLGIQYDIVDQKDSAAFYYNEALANMPDFDNIHYRDIFTAKSVLAYNLGFCVDSVINNLKYVISLTSDEHERIYRFLTLGNILFESRLYDSSRFYLETVFEQQDDIQSKIVAAENLCNIYQKKGDSVNARKYSSYLADFTMAEIEKKKDVSKINELFKNHLAQKQEKQSEVNREKAIKKVIKIIIPIAVIIALVIIVLTKLRSNKVLKEQQETANRILGKTKQQHREELEAERQTHRMEQAAISGRLKRSNQEVRELKEQIKHLDDLAVKTETATSFNEEPICRLIMERVHDGQFKSKIDCDIYKSYALDKQQLLDLRLATDRHFSQFTLRLRKAYPKLTSIDIDYCCLYLLNLTYADVSALMQRAYNTVVERDSKIQKIIGSEKPLPVILMDIARNPSSN